MSAYGSHAQKSVSPQPVAAEAPPQQDHVIDRAVWERILERTAAVDGSEESLRPAEMEAFRAVARRYRGVPFGIEPVLVALVEAVLHSQFGIASDGSGLSRTMAAQIAQTLFEDPPSCERLRVFWARLCGPCEETP